MNQTTTKSIYAVVGNPISQSKSPRIHSMFAEQTGEPITYSAIESPVDQFPQTVKRFFADGGAGLNITAPFKEQAFTIAKQHSDRARLAGAVNTIRLKDGTLYGDNTDGIGLIRDLTLNHHLTLKGRTILLLGAGGAARGTLPSLLTERPDSITLINRTREKAENIVAALDAVARDTNVQLSATDYTSPLPESHYDLLINATSLGLNRDTISTPSTPVPPQAMAPGCCCYDMTYADEPTPFQLWARNHGIQTAPDGLGMLVEQAAESFHLWRGTHPETAPVIAALRRT